MYRLPISGRHVNLHEDLDIDLDSSNIETDATPFKSSSGCTTGSNVRNGDSLARTSNTTTHKVSEILLRPSGRDTMIARRAMWDLLESGHDSTYDPIVVEDDFISNPLPVPYQSQCQSKRSVRLSETLHRTTTMPKGSTQRETVKISSEQSRNGCQDSTREAFDIQTNTNHDRHPVSMSKRSSLHSAIHSSSPVPRSQTQTEYATPQETPQTQIQQRHAALHSRRSSISHTSTSRARQDRVDPTDHAQSRSQPSLPLVIRELPSTSRLNELTSSQKARAKAAIARRMSIEFGSQVSALTPTNTLAVSSTAQLRPKTASSSGLDASYMRTTASRRASLSPADTGDSATPTLTHEAGQNTGLILRGRPAPSQEVLLRLARYETSNDT